MTDLATQEALAERLAERLADKVAERLLSHLLPLLDAAVPSTPADGLVDAQTLAGVLGVSRQFVYEHRAELGVIVLGDGPRPRLRFDVETAKTAMACSSGKRSQAGKGSEGGGSTPPAGRKPRRLPNGLPKPGSVLTIRGGSS